MLRKSWGASSSVCITVILSCIILAPIDRNSSIWRRVFFLYQYFNGFHYNELQFMTAIIIAWYTVQIITYYSNTMFLQSLISWVICRLNSIPKISSHLEGQRYSKSKYVETKCIKCNCKHWYIIEMVVSKLTFDLMTAALSEIACDCNQWDRLKYYVAAKTIN